MARGQILNIPNQGSALVTTLSREEKASLSMLNPNDGVCYVKLNGPASNSPSLWDYKVPSQSYCQLPGPWDSLGVYYLDQSGSGRTAEVNVYELDSQISVPSFIAIGRAVQAAGSSVDISQGSQPANPPASTVRLWADGSGNLHFLASNGTDKTLVDNTTALGGELHGTIGNAIINNGAITSAKINPNTLDLRPQAFLAGDITADRGNGTGVIWLGLGSNRYLFWDSTYYQFGAPAGPIHTGNILSDSIISASPGGVLIGSAGDINASRDGTHGYIWFGSNAQHYLGFDGTSYQMPGANLIVGAEVHSLSHLHADSGYMFFGTGASQAQMSWWNPGQIRCYGQFMIDGNQLYLNNSAAVVQWQNGTYITSDTPNSRWYMTNYSLMIGGGTLWFSAGASNITWNGTYINFSHSLQYNTTGNQVVWPNGSYISGNAGYVQGSQREQKQNIVAVGDHRLSNQVVDPRLVVYSFEWKEDNKRGLGFMLDEMEQVLPAYVKRDEDTGESIGYSVQELIAILWGAVRDLTGRIQKLEAV